MDDGTLLQETHDGMLVIKTVLLGENGDTGLVGELKEVKESHYKLRQRFYTFVGIIAGSGILTGAGFGIAELVQALSG
ncbi:hypothetical protein LCGC14_2475730 [marine sediment metagenome]|uniref:Uncharacterized protein n=1 Tax=marine sediment metagenome TaxID=412755 RepID=A0A0F9B8Z1_9ZZZZ